MARPSFRLRYLGGVLMLCGVLALAACGGAGTSTSSNTGGSSGGTTTATGSNAQAQQIAQKVQQANLKSADINLQATLSSQNQGGATTASTGQMTLNPVRLQLTTTSSTNTSTANGGSNQTKTDEIIDNNKVYVRQSGQSQWHEVTLPNNTTQSLPFVSLQNLSQMQNLQLVGTESVNGMQAYHLRGSGSQSAQGQSGSYTEDVWVNKDNYQPIKMTVVAQSSQGTLTSNATFSNWNGNQTITPPPSNEIAH